MLEYLDESSLRFDIKVKRHNVKRRDNQQERREIENPQRLHAKHKSSILVITLIKIRVITSTAYLISDDIVRSFQ